MSAISQRDAKLVLRSLGTSGQPPRSGALLINVGTEPLLNRLKIEFLEDHCAPFEGLDGGGACKWIEADYGNGKTQFLRCVREIAWEQDYVTAYVELSQDECPLDRPDRVYGAVARAMQARPQEITDVDRSYGLDNVLAQLVDRKFPGVLTGMPDDTLRDQALEWVMDLQNTPVESTAFVTATVKYLAALLSGDEDGARIARMYLRGEPLPAAELKQIGVYEKLDKSSGFRVMRSMSQLIQRSGLAKGVVLLFDEARRTLSLMSTKAQKVACENLLSVINRCNSGELPGTLFLYAVMPEFFTNFATNYPALQQRCGPSTRINLNHLQGIKELDLLQSIGRKIADIFRLAYEDFPEDDETLEHNLPLVATAAIRDTGGTGTRRIMVRTWVQLLNDCRLDNPRKLTPDEVEAMVSGASEQLREVEAEVVEQEGE